MIKQKCSNCGAVNEYPDNEVKKAFPFSREKLICKNCGKTLSVCGGIFKRQKQKDL